MSQLHSVYLIIGSNIEPETNLPRAVSLLAGYGHLDAISSAWESHAVGSDGPNFLNAGVLFHTEMAPSELKRGLVDPIESALGRVRTADKNAARTIDIDVMMVDGQAFNLDRWDNAFVVLPLAELMPEAPHPLSGEKMRSAAERAQRTTWIVQRPGVMTPLP